MSTLNTGGKISFAELYATSILTPDPNDPTEDTFHLHFPDAVEEVEGRAFWLKHLPKLLERYVEVLNLNKPTEIECNCAPEYSHLCWKCGVTGWLKQ